jgi:hypothetical protein
MEICWQHNRLKLKFCKFEHRALTCERQQQRNRKNKQIPVKIHFTLVQDPRSDRRCIRRLLSYWHSFKWQRDGIQRLRHLSVDRGPIVVYHIVTVRFT